MVKETFRIGDMVRHVNDDEFPSLFSTTPWEIGDIYIEDGLVYIESTSGNDSISIPLQEFDGEREIKGIEKAI
jgi:hypothetical protein